MALLAENVPEGDGAGSEGKIGEMEFFDAVGNFGIVGARLADAGEVAFDIGGEDGNADAAEGFGHDLEGDGFPGAGSAGDEAVAIGHLGEKVEGGCALGDEEWFDHLERSPVLRGRGLRGDLVR